jgi:hypothetical protein
MPSAHMKLLCMILSIGGDMQLCSAVTKVKCCDIYLKKLKKRVLITVPFESLQLHSQLVLFELWPAGCGHIAP